MKFAVIVFPGSNCDHDAYHAAKHVLGQECEFVWHKETDLKGADVLILPGGFAHGDYLRTDTPFTLRCQPGQILRIPIAHGEGNYYAEPETLARLEKNRQVIFRYVNERGEATDESNPNGAINNIAGICNASRNVVGLMPHPERACESMLGSADGLVMFESVIASMKSGVAA
jgi:phosphoribosylformylglycinamidine synthase